MTSSDFRFYKNLAELATSNKGKINFFNQNQKAFFLNPDSDEWFNMIKEYAKLGKLSDQKVEEMEEMKWTQMPDSLKLFAFEYCILNGDAYQEQQQTNSLNHLTSMAQCEGQGKEWLARSLYGSCDKKAYQCLGGK